MGANEKTLYSILECMISTFEAHDAVLTQAVELCEFLIASAIQQSLVSQKKQTTREGLSQEERLDIECEENHLTLERQFAFRDYENTWLQYRKHLRSLKERKLRLENHSEEYIQSELTRIKKGEKDVWKKETT